jgi:multidrug resistance efflux pump
MSSEDDAEPIEDTEKFRTLERYAEDNLGRDKRTDVIEAVPPMYMRGSIYLFVVVMIACLALTYYAKVYVIVPVKGAILPEGQNVVVEAQAAGIITDINISPGSKVEAGDVMMVLRQDAAGVDRNTLQDQLEIHLNNRQKATNAILTVNRVLSDPAIASDEPLSEFSEAGAAMVYIANLKTVSQRLGLARKNLTEDSARQQKITNSQIGLQRSTIRNLENNRRTIRSTVTTLEQALQRKREDLERTEKLANDRIIPETQVGTARDQVISAQSSLNQQRQQLAQADLQISQARVEIGNQQAQFSKQQTDLKSQLSTAQLAYDKAIADLTSSIATFEQVLRGTDATIAQARGKLRMQDHTIDKLTITSPVDGEITALNYNTAGQSVGAGSRVAVIVPKDVRPIVVAFVANKDIAEIKEGIAARIKVDAYPFRQFGTVDATVTRVFPLADKPEFAVRLRMDSNFINANGRKEPLEPGLTVQVDLLTKRKRILELIFKKMR